MRNPRRTASTAVALMIGLTLVVGVGVFASSLKGSFGGILGAVLVVALGTYLTKRQQKKAPIT